MEFLGAGGPEAAEADCMALFFFLGLTDDEESLLGGGGTLISSVESEASIPRTSTTEDALT